MSVVVTQDSLPIDLRAAPEHPRAANGDGAALWLGLLGPSFFVLLNLEISYAVTPLVCGTGNHFIMSGMTAVLLIADALAGLAAYRHLRRDWLEDTVLMRPAYTAMLGVLLSALGAVVILAQWMPDFFLSTCQ